MVARRGVQVDEELQGPGRLRVLQENRRLPLVLVVGLSQRLHVDPDPRHLSGELRELRGGDPPVNDERMLARGKAERGLGLLELDLEGLFRRDDEGGVLLSQLLEAGLHLLQALPPFRLVRLRRCEERRGISRAFRDLHLGETESREERERVVRA